MENLNENEYTPDFDLDAVGGGKWIQFVENTKVLKDLFLTRFFGDAWLLNFGETVSDNVSDIEAFFPENYGSFAEIATGMRDLWQPILDETFGVPLILSLQVVASPESTMKFSDYLKITSAYLKTTEAAQLIGVTVKALRKWEKEGKIKAYRSPLNPCRFYRRKDLEEILNDIELVDKVNSKSGSRD